MQKKQKKIEIQKRGQIMNNMFQLTLLFTTRVQYSSDEDLVDNVIPFNKDLQHHWTVKISEHTHCLHWKHPTNAHLWWMKKLRSMDLFRPNIFICKCVPITLLPSSLTRLNFNAEPLYTTNNILKTRRAPTPMIDTIKEYCHIIDDHYHKKRKKQGKKRK